MSPEPNPISTTSPASESTARAPELHHLARPEHLVGDPRHHLVSPERHGGEPTMPACSGQIDCVNSSTRRSVAASAHCSSVARAVPPIGWSSTSVRGSGRPKLAAMRRGDRRELRGGDDDARAPGLLELDGVVDAVGGAAAAVGGAGDHDVGLRRATLLEDVGRARDRRVRRRALRALLRDQLDRRAGARRRATPRRGSSPTRRWACRCRAPRCAGRRATPGDGARCTISGPGSLSGR